MSSRKHSKPLLLSREECDTLLPTCCINAMSTHKLNDREAYLNEIDSLSKICDNLISHHYESVHSVIARIEKVLTEVHNNEIEEIDKKIKHLFNLRKNTPCNSQYCEQEIIKLSTEIRILEERKAMPVKDTIQGIICETLDKAIKVLGADPGDFNLSQYEYHPVVKKSDSNNDSQSNHSNGSIKNDKHI